MSVYNIQIEPPCIVALQSLSNFGDFGDLWTIFHESRTLFLQAISDQIHLFDFDILTPVANTSCKQSVAQVLTATPNSALSLQFVVITEDQFVHLVVLKNTTLQVSVSLDTGQSVLLRRVLLLDNKIRSHIRYENGTTVLLSTEGFSKRQANWALKPMIRVRRMTSVSFFFFFRQTPDCSELWCIPCISVRR
jgi:hypothetical protein